MSKPVLSSTRVRWLVSWLSLTALSVAIHAMAWVPPDHLDAGLSDWAEVRFVKPAANALDVAAGPVWLLMAVVMGDWGVYSLGQSTLANGLAVGAGLTVIARLLRLRRWIDLRKSAPRDSVNPSRRRFLIESPMAAAGVLGGGAAMFGAGVEPFLLRTRRYRVPIADLPAGLEGLRAVLIADTHLGPRMPVSFIQRAIADAIALRPDLVLLGGDYVHAGSRYIIPGAKLFEPIIRAGIPAIGVLGNHDWYNSRGLIATHLRAVGVHMVDNDRVMLDAQSRRVVPEESCREGLCIAGVGDLLTHHIDLRAALTGVRPEVPRLLLSHNPDVAELEAVTAGVGGPPRIDLMLSGHTHGGQISLPLVGPLYVPGDHGSKYAGGLVRGPAFPVVVSRGVGMSICPVRIGVPPELVEITLVRATS